jgi:hypothetical protein
MSRDPNQLLTKLQGSFHTQTTTSLDGDECEWLLAQLKHKDDQIAALHKLTVKPAAPKETLLQEADRITADRMEEYGHPRDDMSRSAAMWEPILGMPPGSISPEKVPMCMIAVKLSRLCNGYHRDSAVDIAGYAKAINTICG